MSLIADEAADEIDILREQLTSVNAERMHAVSSLAEEVARLIRERDEARRLLCDEIWMSRGGRMSVDLIARERGWDCFKEEP